MTPKKIRDKWDNKVSHVVCKSCQGPQHACKCANRKCEKVKEELAEEVTITTDKTEYELGESASVIIKNNFSEEIFISYPIIERIINDNYIPLKGSVVWPGCGVTGGLIYLTLEPSEAVKHQWDQKEKWCSTDFSDRNVYLKEVLSGKYRVKSEIIKRIKSEEEDPCNVSGKPSGEFVYSNEFTIKEKSALDARCSEKVKDLSGVGNVNCSVMSFGYEYDLLNKKCAAVSIKGCSMKTPFKTLKECQEVCEKKEVDDTYKIYMKSRQFIPEIGISNTLKSTIATTSSERMHVLLQFYSIPGNEERSELSDLNVTLCGYIHNNAYFTSIPTIRLEEILNLSFIRSIEHILPEDKLSPYIRDGKIGDWAINEDETVSLTIQFYKDVSLDNAEQMIESYEGTVNGRAESIKALVVAVSQDTIMELAKEDSVHWIEQVSPPGTDDTMNEVLE